MRPTFSSFISWPATWTVVPEPQDYPPDVREKLHALKWVVFTEALACMQRAARDMPFRDLLLNRGSLLVNFAHLMPCGEGLLSEGKTYTYLSSNGQGYFAAGVRPETEAGILVPNQWAQDVWGLVSYGVFRVERTDSDGSKRLCACFTDGSQRHLLRDVEGNWVLGVPVPSAAAEAVAG